MSKYQNIDFDILHKQLCTCDRGTCPRKCNIHIHLHDILVSIKLGLHLQSTQWNYYGFETTQPTHPPKLLSHPGPFQNSYLSEPHEELVQCKPRSLEVNPCVSLELYGRQD